MLCGSAVGNRKINCQCNVVTGFPWGYALSLIHVHFPYVVEFRVLSHTAPKSAVRTAHWSAEHILRNLVLVWKRWEPICRDDLIFYSRNIKRNQLTCFSYHFFLSKRKKSMSRSSYEKYDKNCQHSHRAVIHMKGFVRNYCFFKMECKEKYIFMHRIPK